MHTEVMGGTTVRTTMSDNGPARGRVGGTWRGQNSTHLCIPIGHFFLFHAYMALHPLKGLVLRRQRAVNLQHPICLPDWAPGA